MKDSVVAKCVRFCSIDIRPFYAVQGMGFQELAQEFIRIGHGYGYVNAGDLIPHPTTISRNVDIIVSRERSKLVEQLTKVFDTGYLAGTTDMWTERYKNTAFSTLTLHYIDEEWALRQHVLFTCPFPKDEKKTGVNIRSELIRRFVQLGFSSAQFNEIVFVSDEGANLLAALKPNKHFACCCHLLNTTLKHVFDDTF